MSKLGLYHLAPALFFLLSACAHHHTSPATALHSNPNFQRQVINAIDLGDGDHEIRQLRERMLAEADNAEIRIQLAELYRQAGAPELAIEHYRLAAARLPQNAEIAMLLAKTLRAQRQVRQAIDALVNFCNQNRTAPPALLSLLGTLHDDAGQFAEGEKAYRRALENGPQVAYLHNNLGYNLLLQSKPKLAAEEFREALAMEPHSLFANNNLGLALLAQWTDNSQPEEALTRWQSVSGPAAAHNNLATVLMEQRRYPEARKELEIALDFDRNYGPALHNLQLMSELDGKTGLPRPATAGFWKHVTKVFTANNTSNIGHP